MNKDLFKYNSAIGVNQASNSKKPALALYMHGFLLETTKVTWKPIQSPISSFDLNEKNSIT